jgi:hypothetical protein
MRFHHLQVRIAATTTLLVLVLSGCEVAPGTTASPTTSHTPSGDGELRPTQEPVAPPASEEDAFTQASTTVNDDQAAFFDILRGNVAADSLRAFESGSYLEHTSSFIEAYEGGSISGQADLWIPDYTRSSTSVLVSGDVSYEFSEVTMQGCILGRSSIVYELDPSPAPSTVGLYFPTEVTVTYEPSSRVWLITNQTSLSNYEGATTCVLN